MFPMLNRVNKTAKATQSDTNLLIRDILIPLRMANPDTNLLTRDTNLLTKDINLLTRDINLLIKDTNLLIKVISPLIRDINLLLLKVISPHLLKDSNKVNQITSTNHLKTTPNPLLHISRLPNNINSNLTLVTSHLSQ